MFRKRNAPIGSRPGTFAVDAGGVSPLISVHRYFADSLEVYSLALDELLGEEPTALEGAVGIWAKGITWVDVQGLGNPEVLRKLASIFQLHPLTVADIVNIPQRPKVDFYDSYILYCGCMCTIDEAGQVNLEQLSVIWGNRFLITFQEHHGDILEPVRKRLRSNQGPIRRSGSDYLAHAIVDTSIDGYYPVIEGLGDRLEELEDQILFSPHGDELAEVYRIKRDLLHVRRSIWPQRESIRLLIREETPFIKKSSRIFFRDCHDHVAQVSDVLDSFRELSNSLMDMHLSSVNLKMNEVMKMLTIVGTIFIPLSFIASVFGMNFEYMPELKWRWAYPLFWICVLFLGGGMFYYFYRRGWIGSAQRQRRTD